MTIRWHYILRWLILIFLGLAIYAQTFGYDFVFDDQGFIVNNPDIKSFDHVHYLWKTYPLTRAIGIYTFAFNYYLSQLNPQSYHIFNFIIHLIAAGMIWATAGVLFRLAGWLPSTDWLREEIPFIIAVLFLVHPCQTQAITYISQRFESMATVFYLGSVYSYLCARLSSSKAHRNLLLFCSMVLAILGIFTKEVVATVPLMILAIELIFFNENRRGIIKWGLVLTVAGCLFIILFTKLLGKELKFNFITVTFHSDSHDGDFINFKDYVLTQLRVFLTFMRLMVLPLWQNLDYDYPLSKGLFQPPLSFVGLCLIGAFIISIIKLRRQFPIIAFGLAWILITFSINLAPRFNVIFEHKLYLISFGFFLVLVNVMFIFIRQRNLLIGLLIGMIILLSQLSFFRNQVWKNELTLWNDVVRKSPHKVRSYNGRASAYINRGNFIQAKLDSDKAIEINPKNPGAYINRGISNYELGHFDQALADYNRSIKLDDNNGDTFYNRGILFERLGNFKQALSDYNRAIFVQSNNADVYISRSALLGNLGYLTQALSDCNKAIEIDPDNGRAFYNRAVTYYQLKQYDKALADLSKSEKLGFAPNPGFIHALEKSSGKNR